MPRMIELIRQSAVPANVLRNAARGTLTLPPAENLEILVYLTTHPFFAEQAKLTIASFDQAAALEVARDLHAPPDVLNYISAPANLRPALLEALLANPSIGDARVVDLCEHASKITADTLLASPRVGGNRRALEALAKNHRISTEQVAAAEALLRDFATEDSSEVDAAVEQYMREHAEEIAAESGKPFALFGSTEAESGPTARAKQDGTGSQETELVGFAKRLEDYERPSVVMKIAKMNVGERVQLAMKGNRDERMLLIRDGARMVSSAVLESPKLTDAEIDYFASMKNVGEHILRVLGTKRKFLKRYTVIRLLTMNPKTPLDVSLSLLPHLLTNDLKNLTKNRDIADTIVKVARKMYRDRTMSNKA